MFRFKEKHKLSILLVIAGIILIGIFTPLLLKAPVNDVFAQDDHGHSQLPNDVVGQQAGAASGNPAFSTNRGDIGPLSDGSGVEVIPIGAFRNDGNNVDGWFNLFSGGYIQNAGSQGACFMAPTYPPNGSTLTGIGISLLDKSSDKNLFFAELKRVRLNTGVVDKLAGGDINWNDPNPVELFAPIASGTAAVSNAYAYYFHLCFPANSGVDISLYGATLFYTP
ncbi:MAG: hypothetical protein KDI79_31830 [Anaerolineae bacterium]|nr:hypothetical protein [Anaerolineae bacterium]